MSHAQHSGVLPRSCRPISNTHTA